MYTIDRYCPECGAELQTTPEETHEPRGMLRVWCRCGLETRRRILPPGADDQAFPLLSPSEIRNAAPLTSQSPTWPPFEEIARERARLEAPFGHLQDDELLRALLAHAPYAAYEPYTLDPAQVSLGLRRVYWSLVKDQWHNLILTFSDQSINRPRRLFSVETWFMHEDDSEQDHTFWLTHKPVALLDLLIGEFGPRTWRRYFDQVRHPDFYHTWNVQAISRAWQSLELQIEGRGILIEVASWDEPFAVDLARLRLPGMVIWCAALGLSDKQFKQGLSSLQSIRQWPGGIPMLCAQIAAFRDAYNAQFDDLDGLIEAIDDFLQGVR